MNNSNHPFPNSDEFICPQNSYLFIVQIRIAYNFVFLLGDYSRISPLCTNTFTNVRLELCISDIQSVASFCA